MKTNRIMAIAAAVMALAACTKEQGNCDVATFKEGQEVTLNVTADASATRVTSELNADGETVDFKWAKDDVIKVTVGDKSAEFTLASGAGTASATFTGTMPADGSTFDVQYPVTDPDLTNQTYSSSEAIPHNMMKFAQTGCTTSSPTFSLTPQNAALRLNLWGTSQTISKIVVTNTTSSATYTLNISGGKELSSDSSNPTPFFIVVPAGSWNFSAEVFDNAAIPASICTFTPSAAKTFAANMVLNMPAKEVAVPVLSGDFSISATQTVKFSKGNLYYDGSTSTWGFESNQYDYRTYAGKNSYIGGTWTVTGTPADNWGTFGWVGASSKLTGDLLTKYGMSTNVVLSAYGTSTSDVLYADWADIFTLPKVSGRMWKTMTSSEWTYLLSTRSVNGGTGEGKSYQRATIYIDGPGPGAYGLIIYPDNYTSQTSATSYTSSEWTTMEAAGCVFLPAAGYRYGSSLYNVGSYGYYWSSTPYSSNSDCAYGLYFNSGYVSPAGSNLRDYGQSVRLVSVAQ